MAHSQKNMELSSRNYFQERDKLQIVDRCMGLMFPHELILNPDIEVVKILNFLINALNLCRTPSDLLSILPELLTKAIFGNQQEIGNFTIPSNVAQEFISKNEENINYIKHRMFTQNILKR